MSLVLKHLITAILMVRYFTTNNQSLDFAMDDIIYIFGWVSYIFRFIYNE